MRPSAFISVNLWLNGVALVSCGLESSALLRVLCGPGLCCNLSPIPYNLRGFRQKKLDSGDSGKGSILHFQQDRRNAGISPLFSPVVLTSEDDLLLFCSYCGLLPIACGLDSPMFIGLVAA